MAEGDLDTTDPEGGKWAMRVLLSKRTGLGGTAGLAGLGATEGLLLLAGQDVCLNTGLPATFGAGVGPGLGPEFEPRFGPAVGEELGLVRDWHFLNVSS